MKKNSKKKKLMAAAAALALIAAISGTFAWLTAQDQRINRAESAKVSDDSVTVVEVWEPKPLLPGTEATKEVSVSNTGNANVFVRVSYEEVLKHLTDKGVVTYSDSTTVPTAKYTYVADDPGLGKNMPLDFNYDKLIADGYTELPAAQVTGLEAGTKLLVKGGKTIEPVTGKVTYSWTYKITHEYTTGKYQSMNCDTVIAAENSSNDAKDWDFTVSNLTYGYYKDGYKHSVVNWAKSTLPDEAGAVSGNALLGTQGTRYDVKYDYRDTTLGVSPIPGETPATNTDQIPTNQSQKGVQADSAATALGKSHIRIGYSASITDVATLTADQWVYNEDDGWFYYTSPLKTGTTSNKLLEKLIYESQMGTEYDNASYDLVVKMEAIQATKEALTDSLGWNLGDGSAPTGDTLDIVNALIARI